MITADGDWAPAARAEVDPDEEAERL